MRSLLKSDIETLLSNTELLNEFNINIKEFLFQLNSISINYEISSIEHDNNGNIIGVLIFGNYDICTGSPIIYYNKSYIDKFINKKGINGYMFFVNKENRGKNIDKKLIMYSYKSIKEKKYDYIWIGVDKKLKSHNYWLKHGFEKLFDFSDKASFYIYWIRRN